MSWIKSWQVMRSDGVFSLLCEQSLTFKSSFFHFDPPQHTETVRSINLLIEHGQMEGLPKQQTSYRDALDDSCSAELVLSGTVHVLHTDSKISQFLCSLQHVSDAWT